MGWLWVRLQVAYAPFPSKQGSASVLSRFSHRQLICDSRFSTGTTRLVQIQSPFLEACCKLTILWEEVWYCFLLFFCLLLLLHLNKRWPQFRNGKGHWTLWWTKNSWCAGVLGVINPCGQGIDNTMELIRGKVFWVVRAVCICACTHTWHVSSLVRVWWWFHQTRTSVCPTNNQMCRGQQPPEQYVSAPVPWVSQRCCIEASLVESCYFLHCLREMKLCGAITVSSVVMAELSAGFQKPFIALKCVSNNFVLNMRVDCKGKWWSYLLAMSSSICGSLQLAFTCSLLS